MSRTIYNPTVTGLFSDFDRLFGNAILGFNGQEACEGIRERKAVSHFYEDGDDYVIKAELPGVKKEEIELDVEGDTLRLKASRTEKVGEEEKSYTYARTYTLPDDVNHEQLTASFEDGLLTVKLPKEAAKQPLKIAVK